MSFTTLQFFAFLAAVVAATRITKKLWLQNLILLVASYVFYHLIAPEFLLLMIAQSFINYFIGLRIAKSVHARRYLWVGIVFNLLLLGVFKYMNFFVENVVAFGSVVGLSLAPMTLGILLPAGISFYTFHCISYLVDVHRGDATPARDPVPFLLFIAFFPQLIAGPITRWTPMRQQFEQIRRVSRDDVQIGLGWMLIGYLLKVAVADVIAPVVDFHFNTGYAGPRYAVDTALGISAFGIQIFADFAGYTLIARGVARLFGIRLGANFLSPYLARSPREFWRRWHVSLSTFLRDYLYKPLGGRETSGLATARNLMLTMLLGGLWHGAAWGFVAWGAFHGALLVVNHAWNSGGGGRVPALVSGAFTFLMVCIGWVLFRAESAESLYRIAVTLVSAPLISSFTATTATLVLGLYGVIFLYQVLEQRYGDEGLIRAMPQPVRYGVAGFAVAVIFAVGFRRVPFVYFQF